MKITVDKALKVLNQLRNIEEHKVSRNTVDGKTEEVIIEAIKIPAEKSDTGYWLGRLQDFCESMERNYKKVSEKNQKECSKPATQTVKKDDGTTEEIKLVGQVTIDAEGYEKLKTATETLLEQGEEAPFLPLDREMFKGIEWPASFWGAIGSLLTVPESK